MHTNTGTDAASRCALVLRAKTDKHAFIEYYNLNRGLLEQTLQRYTRHARDRMQMDDMRQEAMLGLLKGVQKYEVSRVNAGKCPEGYVFSWVRAYVAHYARSHGVGSAGRFVSLDRGQDGDDENASVANTIVDHGVDVEERCRNNEARQVIERIYKKLLPKERILLQRRLLADEPETLDAIGKDLCMSRERVRQLEVVLKQKLQTRMSSELKQLQDTV